MGAWTKKPKLGHLEIRVRVVNPVPLSRDTPEQGDAVSNAVWKTALKTFDLDFH